MHLSPWYSCLWKVLNMEKILLDVILKELGRKYLGLGITLHSARVFSVSVVSSSRRRIAGKNLAM